MSSFLQDTACVSEKQSVQLRINTRLIITQSLLFLLLLEEYVPKQILIINLGITRSNDIFLQFLNCNTEY